MGNVSHNDPQGQLAHLRFVAGDAPRESYLEVRYRVPGGGMASEFHSVANRQRVVDAVNRRAASTDVYVGCAPRSRPDGRKQAVEQVWTLWAECDGAAASAAARAFIPRPALVVASGSPGNIHAYWPLRQAAHPREAERANLRLAATLGADLACFDASRILRPPGTWNHKHEPARRVNVVEHRVAVRFELDEVVGGLRHIDTSVVDRRWRPETPRRATTDPLLTISPSTYVSELLGTRAAAGRKVRCPFHDDERPSLHVYPTPQRGWSCYSCRRGGSIYDLAAEVWGTGTKGRDFLELRRRLAEVFAAEIARGRSAVEDRVLNR
jgi:hypothetical protein